MAPDENTTTAVALAEIAGKFDIMLQHIEALKEKQDEMAEHVAQIRDAVYHPYTGLYARIRDVESWKNTYSRVTWIVITAIVGLTATAAYTTIAS
tara:strand:- start:1260 stop:1544 length:285 start_codon:yes stop_codon:yes gene_type:complete